MTIRFRAVPVETSFAEKVRSARRDAFGNSVEDWASDDGRLPCRHCLGEVPVGQHAYLLSYSPFNGNGPYAERGPIFVCSDACAVFEAEDEMPEVVTSRLVNVRAYDAGEAMLYRYSQVAAGGEAGMIARELLTDPEVSRVHIRTARNGCFLCAVERAA